MQIHVVPDPVLRQKAKRIRYIDKSIHRLIGGMREMMYDASGVGLAAPQVGILLRVIVIDTREEEAITLINPEIVRRSGSRTVKEGCLSIPGYEGEVTRAVSVTVKGWNPQGKGVRIKATDLLAQALEHEIDHLSGILYIDHLVSPDSLYRLEPMEQGEIAESEFPAL